MSTLMAAEPDALCGTLADAGADVVVTSLDSVDIVSLKAGRLQARQA